MPTPTDEQQAILDDATRIRVVRAAPGSGKTWLVAEEIRRRLESWPDKHTGIAALSFTNVARDEILASVGSGLHHPHFVGTIDAFVFQYIVRPFVHIYDPQITDPRLIPAPVADVLDAKQVWHSNSMSVQVGPNQKDRVHLFSINAIDWEGDAPVYSATYGNARNKVSIEGDSAKAILEQKRKVWRKSGFMSHSDVTFLAAHILRTPKYGRVACDLICHRYPVLIVDELQDTGYFLARVVYQLVIHPPATSLLVGDPDQAIYEFNGARPDLFNQFEKIKDARVFPMRKTQRCAVNVCTVCNALSDSNAKTVSSTNRAGAAVLICHRDTAADQNTLIEAIRNLPNGVIAKVITRKTRTVHDLSGTQSLARPAFGARSINHLHDAVNCLRRSDTVSALAKATAAVGVAIFNTESPTSEMLKDKEIEDRAWKQGVVKILLSAHADRPEEDLFDWGCRVKKMLEDYVSKMGWVKSTDDWGCRPKTPASRLKDKPRSRYVPANVEHTEETSDCRITTIHGVKGETHDVTVLFVPKTNKDQCPATTWWPACPEQKEERRVAFVATSRPRHLLVMCAHENTVDRMRKAHPDFVALFQEIALDNKLSESLAEIYDKACETVPLEDE